MRDASRTPLFQVSFVMQKETRGVEGLTAFALGEEGVAIGPEDFRLESLSLDRPPAPFDLMLHAVETAGRARASRCSTTPTCSTPRPRSA